MAHSSCCRYFEVGYLFILGNLFILILWNYSSLDPQLNFVTWGIGKHIHYKCDFLKYFYFFVILHILCMQIITSPPKGSMIQKKKCYKLLTDGNFGSAPTPHIALYPNTQYVPSDWWKYWFSILNTYFADLLGMRPGQTTSKNCKILKRKQLNQQLKYSD